MTDYATLRAMIWGKTYPELSSKHTETVCTGAVLESGLAVRLYPVPLRYLDGAKQYAIGDIIEVRAARSGRDNRPESHKIDASTLRVIGHVDTDKHGWAERRAWIARDTSWHYESIEQLDAQRLKDASSMGLITPGEIIDVRVVAKPERERAEHALKAEGVGSQSDLFLPEYKELEYLPNKIRLRWRCARPCSTCTDKPHNHSVIDWGLLELARRDGWEAARLKLETIANLATHDFRLFMGNFFLHQHTWGIIGLWYPKRSAQQSLL